MSLRVVGPDPRLTRIARSLVSAEERARRVALLVGEAEIQQRTRGGAWTTIERYAKTGSRVSRVEGRR